MRTRQTRLAGAAAAVVAAGLAGYSLRPVGHPASTLASRNPAAEIRTQVIRRTVHVVHHTPDRAHGRARGGAIITGGHGGPVANSVRTTASRSRAAGSTAPAVGGQGAAVTTRASASHATASTSAPGGAVAGSAPVTTRTSPGHASVPATSPGQGPTTSGAPVTTRASQHGPAGGPSGRGSGSAGAPIRTRSSGAKRGGDESNHGD